jgi:hypothetical protein
VIGKADAVEGAFILLGVVFLCAAGDFAQHVQIWNAATCFACTVIFFLLSNVLWNKRQ